METWLIPTIGLVIAFIFGVIKVAVPLTKLSRSVATKDDIKNLRDEMKSDHATLLNEVKRVDSKLDRHIEFHAGYKFKDS